MARPQGSLVLVVGASGVGKDTLIAGARQALQADKRFTFVRRIVTRSVHADVEDHDSVDAQTFDAMAADGRFALSWHAHGLCYGLPLSVDTDVALGHIVVANVSRHVIAQAVGKYSACTVVLVTAETTQRARRLAARGRESAEEVAARLRRDSSPVPQGIDPIIIDNSGRVADGIAAFVAALRAIANH